MPQATLDPASLPRHIHIDDAHRIVETPQRSRWTTAWPQANLIRPVSRTGGLAYSPADVVRGALLLAAQRLLGITSPVAMELVRSLKDDEVLSLLVADMPVLEGEVTIGQEHVCYRIQLDAEYIARVRSRLARLPR
jgi:hypothetical protein